MDKIYRVSNSRGIVEVEFTQKPTVTDLKELIDEIVENYSYELRLFDLTGIHFDLSNEEIQKIADYGKIKYTKKSKVAFVAPDDLTYGLLRVFSVLREQDVDEITVFRSKEKAVEWLLYG